MAGISDFIQQYGPLASSVAQQLGIDPSIILGHWGLETGWGKSVIPGTNNIGNIKGNGPAARDNMLGTSDNYQAYDSPEQFGNGYARLIATRYSGAVGAGSDAKQVATALKGGGYAQDPQYASKIVAATNEVRNANNAPIDASQVKWDDGSQAGPDPSKVKWDDGPPPAPPMGFMDQLGRQLGLTARAAGHGIADALGTVANPMNAVVNTIGQAIGHNPHLQDVNAVLGNMIDRATPNPQGGVENAVQGMGSAMANPLNALVAGAVGPATGVSSGIVKGAIAGGAQAGMSPIQPGESLSDYLKRIAVGGATGGVVGGATAGVGSAIRGMRASPEVQTLVDAGVVPTPGQMGGNAAAQTEEKLSSIPFVGDTIKSAKGAANEQFNRALYNRALAPLGQTIPRNVATGSEAVAYVNRTIGKEFDNVETQAIFRPGGLFQNDLRTIRTQLAQAAPSRLDQFDTIVNEQIAQKLQPMAPGLPPSRMAGDAWGDSRSMISGLERQLRLGVPDSDKLALADALDDLNGAMTAQVVRNSPAQIQPQLRNASNAWTQYKQIERAAGGVQAMGNNNIFTPAQYLGAVRTGATQAQRGTSTGLNMDIATAAKNVLGSKYPDSGTAGRGILANLALGGGLATVLHNPIPLAIGGMGATAYGTETGRRAMMALLLQRPDLMRQLGTSVIGTAPLMGLLGGAAVNSQ
jgi:hypothetical protein